MYLNDDEKLNDLKVSEATRKYNENGHCTYVDYASWDDETRYELIDGVAYAMSAPGVMHQSILMDLSRQFATFLKGKLCKVFAAPFDVCLNGKGNTDNTVVQPDLIIVCDEEKIENHKYCNGAPDLVIEILSPSTARMDRFIKLNKYLQAGVKEYWIIDPNDDIVNVYILENGKYIINAYDRSENIKVSILDGCIITLPEVFE